MMKHHTIHDWDCLVHKSTSPEATAKLVRNPELLTAETNVLETIMGILVRYERGLRMSLSMDDAAVLQLAEPTMKIMWGHSCRIRAEFFQALLPRRKGQIADLESEMQETVSNFDFNHVLKKQGDVTGDPGTPTTVLGQSMNRFVSGLYGLLRSHSNIQIPEIEYSLETHQKLHGGTRRTIELYSDPDLIKMIPAIKEHRGLVLPMYTGKLTTI